MYFFKLSKSIFLWKTLYKHMGVTGVEDEAIYYWRFWLASLLWKRDSKPQVLRSVAIQGVPLNLSFSCTCTKTKMSKINSSNTKWCSSLRVKVWKMRKILKLSSISFYNPILPPTRFQRKIKDIFGRVSKKYRNLFHHENSWISMNFRSILELKNSCWMCDMSRWNLFFYKKKNQLFGNLKPLFFVWLRVYPSAYFWVAKVSDFQSPKNTLLNFFIWLLDFSKRELESSRSQR